jgi:hypothetical protein
MNRLWSHSRGRLGIATVAVTALAACAPRLPSAGGDPASSALTSRISYQTPFAGYVRMDLVGPRPWRATNDRVRDLGGPDAQMLGDSDEDPIPSSKQRVQP